MRSSTDSPSIACSPGIGEREEDDPARNTDGWPRTLSQLKTLLETGEDVPFASDLVAGSGPVRAARDLDDSLPDQASAL